MAKINKVIFNYYKPLRNQLRESNLEDSIYVIWAYSNFLSLKINFPEDIEVSKDFLMKDDIGKLSTLPLWELEILLREVILNSTNFPCKKSFKKWSFFAHAIDKIKKLENEISRISIDGGNIMTELHRLSHREFPWQAYGPNKDYLAKYFLIYRQKEIDDIIERKIGLTAEDLFFIGFTFFGYTMRNAYMPYPPNIEIDGITKKKFDIFIECFSDSIDNIKGQLSDYNFLNEKFSYAFNPLRAKPILRMNFQKKGSLVCAMPPLFFWALTNGIYYRIYDDDKFDNAYGDSFEKYIGLVIEKHNYEKHFSVNPEEKYKTGKGVKKSSDWILEDNDSYLFIECKTKRLTLSSKEEIFSSEALESDLDILSDSIIQIYFAISDFKENKYKLIKYENRKKVFPMIVTLEDWFLFGDLLDKLEIKVKEKFKENNLPFKYLIEMPYVVCSSHEFEESMPIIKQVGIENFFKGKVFDDEKKKWSLMPYINENFKDIKRGPSIFEDIFDQIFPCEILKRIKQIK